MRFLQLSLLYLVLLMAWNAYSAQSYIPAQDTVKEQINNKDFQIRQVAFLPWDEKDGIPYMQVPGANLGVTSFEIIDSANMAFLSDASNEILIYNLRKKQITGRLMVLPAPRDFAFDSGKYYVLGEKSVEIYDSASHRAEVSNFPDEFQGVMRISRTNATTNLLLPSGNSLKPGKSDGINGLSIYDGWFIKNDLCVKTRILNDHSVELTILLENKKTVSKIFTWQGKISGAFAIGMSGDRIILDVQTWISENPVAVERHLAFFSYTENKSIELRGMLKVPDQYFVLTNKDFTVDKSGILYHMVTSREGVIVFSITESETGSSPSDYPAFLKNERNHFNDHLFEVDPFNKTGN